jgi:molybdenum cofactor synthesis domain-containing protein
MSSTACLIVIGNEVLSGRTQDANINQFACTLAAVGIPLKEARVIADDEDVIIKTVQELAQTYTYVFTTGGIGPTHDDITAASIAKAFNTTLHRHPEAEKALTDFLGQDKVNEARLKMADVPVGATLIENPVSVAPGFQIENVFVMAGIPKIAAAMLNGVKNKLAGGPIVQSITVEGFVKEGDIAERLTEIQAQFPDVEIGSYPFFKQERIGVALVARSSDTETLAHTKRALQDLVRDFS